jgi:aryl-alcohol dehydrogenase-like predicted oxidoreductase
MQYRRLGGTDLDVSVICLGPMRAAAKAPGDDAISRLGERALRRALDGGVNFIHSSYEYGTRWMMQRVLEGHPRRAELHHVIKVPVPDFADGGRFDAAKFRLRVEEALRDLAAERISVLQWMWRSEPNEDELRLPMLGRILDDAAAAFERMRDEGKVGYLMTFPYTVACGQAASETGRFAGLIAYYNLVEMEMADLFADLQARGMGFIAIRPLYQGILTDARRDRASLPAGDRFRDAKFAEDFRRRRAVAEAFAKEMGGSMTRFAIRFALAAPVVASVVVGLNTPEQVDGILDAADGPFPSPDLVAKAQRLWRSGFEAS